MFFNGGETMPVKEKPISKITDSICEFFRRIVTLLKFLGKFFSGCLIWLITIPINFIPICAAHTINMTKPNSLKIIIVDWLKTVVSDKDFLFVCIATLWALFVGMFFLKASKSAVWEWLKSIITILSLILFVSLLVAYVLLCASPLWMDIYQLLNPLRFNTVICVTTCIVGFCEIFMASSGA